MPIRAVFRSSALLSAIDHLDWISHMMRRVVHRTWVPIRPMIVTATASHRPTLSLSRVTFAAVVPFEMKERIPDIWVTLSLWDHCDTEREWGDTEF